MWRRFLQALTLVSTDLVLPPGMRWVGHNVLAAGCETGIIIGHRYWMREALVLFPRKQPCRFEYCSHCGTGMDRFVDDVLHTRKTTKS